MSAGAAPDATRPVEPRLAATLLLARDATPGPEVLMVRRHDGSSFAAGALVFPGGAVQAEDADAELGARCRGLDGLEPGFAAAAIAAIRETFEECGILLARRAGGGLVGGAAHRSLVERYQTAVAHEATAWLAMLRAEGLELACDLLVRYAHWITPASRPKRFDTHFFLAPAPLDQVATHDQREAVEAIWAVPEAVVAGADDGRFRLVFATRMNLLKLAASATVADALATARTARIVTVTPRLESGPDGQVLRIPLEAGYGVEVVPADNIPRA
jgi:8-oxo-dGTP pyrophosphatase MutT (NUDIX family)